MALTTTWLLLLAFACISLSKASSRKCFRASVVEHILIGEDELVDDQDPLKNVRKNLQAFGEAAERAAGEHADIIVFPEEGIFGAQDSSNPNLTRRQTIKLLAEDIPDPRQGLVNPCIQEQEFSDRLILQSLSCIARRNNIYLVANLADIKNSSDTNLTNDGILMYNTQIALDRKGNLLARYHKRHLYGEYHYNVPEMELVYFDTDFEARIGMYICFDRLFRGPMIPLIEEHNVTTMALSTWFFDEYPFLVSPQIDQGWSMGLKVNILSSNGKHISTGTTGSGIFSPKYVAAYTHDTSPDGATIYPMQIVATVPVDPKSGHKCDPDPWIVKQTKYRKKNVAGYQSFYGDFNELVTRQLCGSEGRGEVVCDDELCCSFDYKIRSKKKANWWSSEGEDTSSKTYYLGAKSRPRKGYYQSNYTSFEQACFIISYNNETSEYVTQTTTAFEKLRISGNFSTEYRYPSALGNAFKLIKTSDLHFTGNELSVSTKKPLIYAGIYARVYDRDPPYVQSDFGTVRLGSNPVNG